MVELIVGSLDGEMAEAFLYLPGIPREYLEGRSTGLGGQGIHKSGLEKNLKWEKNKNHG